MRYPALLCTLLLSAYSHCVAAQWLQTTGVAPLTGQSSADARQQAINDAITQALQYSGVSLSSVQTLSQGVLTQDSIRIQSQGQVQQILVLEEQQQDGLLSVTLQLDIQADAEIQQCQQSGLRNHFALTRAGFANPQQARDGQIFDIPQAFSKQLFALMSQAELNVRPTPYFKEALDVAPFFSQQYDYDEQLIDYVGNASNSQFVLLSHITDVSLGQQLNSDYAFWADDSFARFFNVEFILFDALSFEKVWQQAYHTQGPWDFDKTALVDVHSGIFWQSQYGRSVSALSQQVMYDLNQALQCQPSKGQIKHIEDQQVIINLGKDNGLTLGQELTLAHNSQTVTYAGKRLPRQITTLYRVEITQLYQHSAVASNVSKRPLQNIQLNDLVLVNP
ncbi:flagellar assembly protein T N-terminal domain-containing protein [Pseudoalteromonas sp. BDTF-M6]|uniref:flagellar assembly protein T N-terminal domain-containing protein n=1 Tax=Pseudoalteromonas sp. BDTF-M6 TaxID=2796132 RepID=UPI001BAEC586|nr:flagellar assembly protein T N-terminal domain-containing protein [Pseudoalteromonas sp. BDTF-M6]MBS3798776.1 flagellar assembly protein T N-terminal domain-containing protein [Pseudoalteromonas sp. BDTF-M6]